MRIIGFARMLLFAVALLAMSAASSAQVLVSVNFAPPPLPVYAQPPCPADGYLWVPGYWAYDANYGDYYWVPGTWVLPPQPGLLWTPGYWAWTGNRYAFYDGYWGPRVGFYGGVVYGFGYFGHGYEGGRWQGGRFFYNRSVNNVNVTNVRNVYNTTVINKNVTVNRVSYNGGNGGISARPSSEDEAAQRERRSGPTSLQTQNVQAARGDQQLRASQNQGKPPVAATAKPGVFRGREAVSAQEAGGPYNPPANRGQGQPRASEQNPSRPTAPNTGKPEADRGYQRQQEQLTARQDKERQKLQDRQGKENQRLEQQKADDARRQQLEQKHQQQTQQLQQKHTQQMQKLQQKQQPPNRNQAKPPKGAPPA